MTNLSIEQMLYLLYTVAYSENGTVTQGTVKEHLSKEFKNNADNICDALCQKKLLESPKKRRISVTENGMNALITNLQSTEYEFNSSKGQKVLNTLLYCLKQTRLKDHADFVAIEDIDFDSFVDKFKKLYFSERKQQELRGVVAIRKQDICKKFNALYPISQLNMEQHFGSLKSTGQIFTVTEKDEELIQWVE